jgi:hypothetical protein
MAVICEYTPAPVDICIFCLAPLLQAWLSIHAICANQKKYRYVGEITDFKVIKKEK